MKKALLALAATFVAVASYAQGQLAFDTYAVDYKVMRPGGAAPGSDITAQLFLVGAGGVLTPLTPATTFYGAEVPEAARVYNVPVDVIVPGVASGQQATLRFRAFSGSAFDGAQVYGESSDFPLTLGGGIVTPPNLDPLAGQTLTLTVVPEPSTIALGVIGAAALLFRRRK